MTRWLWVASVVVATGAAAQSVYFTEGFEAPGSETGSGWDLYENLYGGPVQWQRLAAAAHTHDAGVRFSQPGPFDAGAVEAVRLYKSAAGAASGPDGYARVWFRASPTTREAAYFPLALRAFGIGTVVEAPITVLQGGRVTARLKGAGNPFGVSVTCPSLADVTLNQWSLLELWAKGMGTSAGSYVAALDTVPYCAADGVDWQGRSFRELMVGSLNGTTYEGVMELDDVAWATAPLPSKVSLRAGSPDAGCLPVFVTVSTSFDAGFLPAPVNVRVLATLPGALPGSFCSGDGSATVSALDAPVLAGEVRVQPGLMLNVASELVGPTLPLDLEPTDAGPFDAGANDGGPDRTPSLAVACGCGAATGLGPLSGLALLCLARGRLRRLRASPARSTSAVTNPHGGVLPR